MGVAEPVSVRDHDRKGAFDAVGPGPVYVDVSVGSGEFLERLRRHAIRAVHGRLRSGDFAFRCGHVQEPSPFCDGNSGCTLGIERKTLSDCCGSLLKGRLNKQVPDMLTDYTMSWIVVEGIWRPGNDDAIEIPKHGRSGEWEAARVGVTYSQLSSWLVRYDVMGSGRLHRWRTSSPGETMAFIASVYRWWQKEWSKHKAEAVQKMPAPMKALLWKPNEKERIFAGFNTIGVVNMRTIARKFPSILDFMLASQDEMVAAGMRKADAAVVWTTIRRSVW